MEQSGLTLSQLTPLPPEPVHDEPSDRSTSRAQHVERTDCNLPRLSQIFMAGRNTEHESCNRSEASQAVQPGDLHLYRRAGASHSATARPKHFYRLSGLCHDVGPAGNGNEGHGTGQHDVVGCSFFGRCHSDPDGKRPQIANRAGSANLPARTQNLYTGARAATVRPCGSASKTSPSGGRP